MMSENQESQVWERVMGMPREKPEPVERPYPTEPALPRPEPIERPYPTRPAYPRPEPIPRPEPQLPEPCAALLEQAMEALRTYRMEEERSRGTCKRLWQQLAYYQNQQCHRLLMVMQRCR